MNTINISYKCLFFRNSSLQNFAFRSENIVLFREPVGQEETEAGLWACVCANLLYNQIRGYREIKAVL